MYDDITNEELIAASKAMNESINKMFADLVAPMQAFSKALDSMIGHISRASEEMDIRDVAAGLKPITITAELVGDKPDVPLLPLSTGQ